MSFDGVYHTTFGLTALEALDKMREALAGGLESGSWAVYMMPPDEGSPLQQWSVSIKWRGKK